MRIHSYWIPNNVNCTTSEASYFQLCAGQYQNDPVSWFQKKIRGNTTVLTDHISKEMNELNLIRCKKIPKRPGADWHDLPDEKVPTEIFELDETLFKLLLASRYY